MPDNPSNGLMFLRTTVGRFGVGGAFSFLGFAIAEAPRARVCELSRRRFGASLILGCV